MVIYVAIPPYPVMRIRRGLGAIFAYAPKAVKFGTCSGCSSSDAATGSDPDRQPVAGVRCAGL